MRADRIRLYLVAASILAGLVVAPVLAATPVTPVQPAVGATHAACNVSDCAADASEECVQGALQFNTLEDLYGDTGNQFRAAVEFFTREATPSTPSGQPGFGIAIDDMVISWKETRLDADPGHCATDAPGGQGLCAILESSTGFAFESSSIVNLTVTDATPYGVAPQDKNDCNGDGDYSDSVNHCWNIATGSGSERSCASVGGACGFCSVTTATSCVVDPNCPVGETCKIIKGELCYAPDGTDCNANGTSDVTVKLTTDAPGETTGEIAVLDRVGSSSVYRGTSRYSTLYDSPGTLFVVQDGTQAPRIHAVYADRNDGTGTACKSNLDPAKRGMIEADTAVAVTTGRIVVNAYKVNLMSVCSLNTAKPCSTNADCSTSEGLCYSCSAVPAKPCDPYQTSGTNFCIAASQGTCQATNDRACSNAPSTACTQDSQCPTGAVGLCVSRRGDADGFADTGETIALQVQFANKSGVDVDELTVTLGSNSANIECVSRPVIAVGSLANGALSVPRVCVATATGVATTTACTTDNDCTVAGTKCGYNYLPFVFKVANVNRTSLTQTLQAPLTITMHSSRFDALTRATTLTLDLDLNASGASTIVPFSDDFEQSDFAQGTSKFQRVTLDANKNSLANSFGYRCQYNDPFGLNSNSVGTTDCFLGFATDPTQGVNDWHIHKSTDGSMGRAFNGVQSAHFGVHPSAASPTLDTYRFKQMDAIATINPVNLPLSSANPELNFVQQVDFLDSSSGLNVTPGESPDRGIVEVQLSSTGVPQGSWIKIYPFVNIYDEQGTDDFANCLFDPVDDGNNEKDFFDPTDPDRRYGPSSTCYPEFNFVRQGEADYRKNFNVNDIGLASDGPGLQGCSGPGCLPANTPAQIFNPGTWVRPRFSLAAFGARSVRLRFLATTMDTGQRMSSDPGSGAGAPFSAAGWYIDDVHIDAALASALTLSADGATVDPLACTSCASLASAITVALDAAPAATFADGRRRILPGQAMTLDAGASTVAGCPSGVPQYQFWTDGDPGTGALPDGIVGDAGDNLLRDWSEDATLIVAPPTPGWWDYGVKVRCSTNPACGGSNSAILPVIVDCPENRTEFPVFPSTLRVDKASLATPEPDSNVTVSWASPSSLVDVLRGNLVALRNGGGRYFISELACTADINGTSVAESMAVAVSEGYYYLARAGANAGTACNQKPTYSDGSATEMPGRDVGIAQDPVTACP